MQLLPPNRENGLSEEIASNGHQREQGMIGGTRQVGTEWPDNGKKEARKFWINQFGFGRMLVNEIWRMNKILLSAFMKFCKNFIQEALKHVPDYDSVKVVGGCIEMKMN